MLAAPRVRMSLLVQPRLINDPFGDPGLYIDFRFGRRGMLFDLGDTSPLSPRELIRVSHAFVSHAHMDHVAGLDRLLRLRLHRPRPLALLGPRGFVDQIEQRLGSYSWNLLDETSVDFRLSVEAFDDVKGRIEEAAEFRARDRFRRRKLEPPLRGEGTVLADPDFEVRAVALDHGIPSLAFAFRQRRRINVWRSALDEMGLPVGSWIDAAKRAAREGLPDDHFIDVPTVGQVPLGVLRSRAFRCEQGQRFAYVADAADTPDNRSRIIELARDVDQLFIETPFAETDREIAAATRHLTARAAGEIAQAARVKRVHPFHFSARYGGDPTPLAVETEAAFSSA